MQKSLSPSFVLSLEMHHHPRLFSLIEGQLEILRAMYNSILDNYLTLEKQMKREKQYKKRIRQRKGVLKKLEHDKENKELLIEKKWIQQELVKLREKHQLTEYSSHEWVKPIRKHFGNKVNAAISQKIASRAWHTFSKKLFGKANKVCFLRKGKLNSFEGKANSTGWRYREKQIVYKDLFTRLKYKESDQYISEILNNVEEKKPFSYVVKEKGITQTRSDFYRVKFVRIVKKIIRGKVRYFADIVICGYPPSKERKMGQGRVGLDIGTSSIAISSFSNVALVNLAEQVKTLAKKITITQRKMDRSQRSLNPHNFKDNGTIKKGKKTWVYSNRYQKLQLLLKKIYRKQAVIRKLSHQTLANHLLELGDTFYTETMHFKALQKRKRKTEVSEKTGRFKRKKRFGKSIGHRAPAMFLTILEEKVKRYGGTFFKVNTKTFKASQYCHIQDIYIKKPLSQRWHKIDEHTLIQRDLYSSFLLMNSNQSGTKPNQKRCRETFPQFKRLHDQKIEEIRKQKKMILNSGIIVSS